MSRKYFLPMLISGLLSVFQLYGQKPVDVTESTLKLGIMAEEVFYFGFAEGDQLIFNFEEANGKELKELEIVEMPSSSRFLDYKTKKIENKIITIPRTGIYKFRFTNSAFGIRVCKYKIQRIPASPATQNFNTAVYSHVVDDTTYTTEQENYLAYTDTVLINLQDRVVKVNPTSTVSNKAAFNFILPENTIAWSYYISTGPAGQQAYQEAFKKVVSNSGPIVSKFPFYNPLSALARGAEPYLTKLESGQNINYWIVEGDNADLFINGAQFRFMKKGRAVNDYSKMENRKGTLYFCFSNDDPAQPVAVAVKLTAIQVNPVAAVRQIQIMHIAKKNEMYLKN